MAEYMVNKQLKYPEQHHKTVTINIELLQKKEWVIYKYHYNYIILNAT